MKKTVSNILFAALAVLAVASCQKEPGFGQESEAGGARVLTASFAASDTKSTLDGKTPKWEVNDEVKLTDGTVANTQTFKLVTNAQNDNEAQIASDGASFTVTVPEGWANTIYAVYPASAYSSIDGSGNIVISIPTSQDGSFASANICAAKCTDGKVLSFRNATAILKIDGKTSTISSIEIPATDIAGTYTISGFDGGTLSASVSSGEGKITLSGMSGSGPFYVAAAPVSIPASTTLTYKDSGSTEVGSRTTGSANTLALNKIYSIGPAVPTNAIPGLFSVSSNKKVAFSKGNLWCNTTASPIVWYFEDNQYDTNNASSIYNSAHVSRFFWSKTASIAYAKDYSESGSASDVLFTNKPDAADAANPDFTVSSQSGMWRALTGGGEGEWKYLIETREKAADLRKSNVTVCDIGNCLVIAPDGFTGTIEDSYTAEAWVAAEASGLVCLSPAGYRENTLLKEVGKHNYYWSSTPNGEYQAYFLYFYSEGFYTANSGNRNSKGSSIRLVTE